MAIGTFFHNMGGDSTMGEILRSKLRRSYIWETKQTHMEKAETPVLCWLKRGNLMYSYVLPWYSFISHCLNES